MKGFAKVVLGLFCINAGIGVIVLFSGSVESAMAGAAMIGGGFLGILLCCVVMALADIRDTLKAQKVAAGSLVIESAGDGQDQILKASIQHRHEREAAAALARPVLSTEQIHAALNKL